MHTRWNNCSERWSEIASPREENKPWGRMLSSSAAALYDSLETWDVWDWPQFLGTALIRRCLGDIRTRLRPPSSFGNVRLQHVSLQHTDQCFYSQKLYLGKSSSSNEKTRDTPYGATDNSLLTWHLFPPVRTLPRNCAPVSCLLGDFSQAILF